MAILNRIIISSVMFFLVIQMGKTQDDFQKILAAFSNSYVLESEGNYKEAADQIKSVYHEDSYEFNLRLGWLNYMSGNFNESISFYQRSMELMPYSDEAKFGFTFPLSALGRWDEVVTLYKEVLANSPHNTKALYYLGTIYYNRGQLDKAIKKFELIVDLYPFDYDGLIMYAWTNLQLGRKKDAKILFQKALLNRPNDASALEGLKLTLQ